jgi:isoaspartyl peptidase/L-asparaginase-like protein (Ntn-hydrolase superfamily)
MTVPSFEGKTPTIGEGCWAHPSAAGGAAGIGGLDQRQSYASRVSSSVSTCLMRRRHSGESHVPKARWV